MMESDGRGGLPSVARQVVMGGAYELGGKMTQEDYLVCILDMNQYIPTALAPSSDSNHVKRSFCAVFDGKYLISLAPSLSLMIGSMSARLQVTGVRVHRNSWQLISISNSQDILSSVSNH